MTEFLFVRHGESVANLAADRVGGQSNTAELTERGRQQARLLGAYLHQSNITPDAVFTSGAVRTQMTAQIALAEAGLTLPVAHDARLLEMSQGEYEDMLRTHVYTPENIAKYDITSMHGKLPGGDSMHDVQQRMAAFIQEKTLEYPNGQLLVFGHGLAIRAIAGMARGFSKKQILTEITDNISLTRIETNGSTMTVHFVGKNVIPEYT